MNSAPDSWQQIYKKFRNLRNRFSIVPSELQVFDVNRIFSEVCEADRLFFFCDKLPETYRIKILENFEWPLSPNPEGC